MRIIDDHAAGVDDIDADLNHRRGNKNLDFIALKAAHRLLLFLAVHPAMHQSQAGLSGKRLFQMIIDFCRVASVKMIVILDCAADDINLSALRQLPLQLGHHRLQTVVRNQSGDDLLPSRRHRNDSGNVHIAINR